MTPIAPQILLFLEIVIFAAAVFLHLTKKNSSAVRLYIAQSSAISLLLLLPAFEESSPLLVIAIIATITVKLFIAPYFFFGLIKKHRLKFSVSTYLNTPITRPGHRRAGRLHPDRCLQAPGAARGRRQKSAALVRGDHPDIAVS